MPCALAYRSEEHTSELQSPCNLVCRLLLEKKKEVLPRAVGTAAGAYRDRPAAGCRPDPCAPGFFFFNDTATTEIYTLSLHDALPIFLAYFVAWRAQAINTRYTLYPAAMAVGLVILAVVVADLGTAVVLGVTATVVFFVAGLRWRFCAIAAGCALVGLVFFIALKPYRLARIAGYLDPGSKIVSQIDPAGHLEQYMHQSLTSRDTSYQLAQSKIAVGTGGAVGAGLRQGKQKVLYLPEAHTDFIYAVVSEELGLVGSAGLLL